MKSIIDPAPGDTYASADYETLESRAAGVRAASGGELTPSNANSGSDAVHFQLAAGVPHATPTVIDANHDWRDRVVEVLAFAFSAATERPGGSADYTDWATIGAGTPGLFAGYLGTGALSNVGTGAAVGIPVAVVGTVGYVVAGLSAPGLPDYTLGFVYLPALAVVVAVSVLLAPVGARLAHRMPVLTLKRVFALLLFLLATKMAVTYW